MYSLCAPAHSPNTLITVKSHPQIKMPPHRARWLAADIRATPQANSITLCTGTDLLSRPAPCVQHLDLKQPNHQHGADCTVLCCCCSHSVTIPTIGLQRKNMKPQNSTHSNPARLQSSLTPASSHKKIKSQPKYSQLPQQIGGPAQSIMLAPNAIHPPSTRSSP